MAEKKKKLYRYQFMTFAGKPGDAEAIKELSRRLNLTMSATVRTLIYQALASQRRKEV